MQRRSVLPKPVDNLTKIFPPLVQNRFVKLVIIHFQLNNESGSISRASHRRAAVAVKSKALARIDVGT